MAGKRFLSHLQLGKETTAGNAVAATRRVFPEGSGILDEDPQLTFHEDRATGVKNPISYATQMGEVVAISYRTAPATGVYWDELLYPFCQLDGGNSGTGAGADKAWTFTPTEDGDSAPEAFTIETGDATQNYEVEYCHALNWELSASRDSMTQLAINWFGRQVTKSTKTSVASSDPIRIPGYLWTIKHATAQSGLTAASVETNFLRSFTLHVDTGLFPEFYLDGNVYFGQMQEKDRKS